MKLLAISGLVLWCAVGAAHAQPAVDPLRGIDIGMKQTDLKAMVESSGAKLDCREHQANVNQALAPVHYCRADLDGGASRIEAVLAPEPGGGVLVFTLRGPTASAPGVREALVRKLGKPALSPPEATGFLDTAKWKMGARLTVHSDGCRRGQSFCVEASQNPWARQAARSVGMELALP